MAHEEEQEPYEIAVSKEAPDADWYIQVTGPKGGFCYDGYWPNSDKASKQEAIKEAIKGSNIPDGYPYEVDVEIVEVDYTKDLEDFDPDTFIEDFDEDDYEYDPWEEEYEDDL